MEVLFISAGATTLATFLMAMWNRVQCNRFETLAAQIAGPASRIVARPTTE